jgi:CHAD domain-containing protein
MRSALHAYSRVVDRDRTRHLAEELKWLAGVLAAARDLEVLDARISDAVTALPAELVLGPVQAQVTRYFAGRRASAHHDVLAALDSDRYLALLTAIDDLLAEPPLSKAARGKARREGGALIWRAYRRVDTPCPRRRGPLARPRPRHRTP